MKNRVMIDLFCIFGLGAVYFALIYLAAAYSLPENLGLTPEHGDTFAGDFSYWSFIVAGFSVLAVLAWYVLGEWGPRAQSWSSGKWMALWLFFLAVVLVVGFVATFEGPQATDNAFVLPLFYFGGGIIFYWFATMCFSPVGIKTAPPGARWVRRW
ncbi:MAG: hypothetical protein ACLP59_10720 [Bryobacteraceae bacterium]